VPAPKIYLTEVKQGLVPETIWFYSGMSDTPRKGKRRF